MAGPVDICGSVSLKNMLLRALDAADVLDLPMVAIRISEAIDAMDSEYEQGWRFSEADSVAPAKTIQP